MARYLAGCCALLCIVAGCAIATEAEPRRVLGGGDGPAGGSGGGGGGGVPSTAGAPGAVAGSAGINSGGGDPLSGGSGGGGGESVGAAGSVGSSGSAGGAQGGAEAGAGDGPGGSNQGGAGTSAPCAIAIDVNDFNPTNPGCGGYGSGCKGRIHISNEGGTPWAGFEISFSVAPGVTCTKTHASAKWIISDDGSMTNRCVFTAQNPDGGGSTWSVEPNGAWSFGYDTTQLDATAPSDVSVTDPACG